MIEGINLLTIDSCKELCSNATFNVRIDFMMLIASGFLLLLTHKAFRDYNMNCSYYNNKTSWIEEHSLPTGLTILFFGILLGVYRLSQGVLVL